jgi:hypothetical protein
MITCNIVIQANSFNKRIDFGRFNTLFSYKRSIFKDKSCKITQVFVGIAEYWKVNIVKINKTWRSLITFWNFDNIKYL